MTRDCDTPSPEPRTLSPGCNLLFESLHLSLANSVVQIHFTCRKHLAENLRSQIGAARAKQTSDQPAMPTYGTTVRSVTQHPPPLPLGACLCIFLSLFPSLDPPLRLKVKNIPKWFEAHSLGKLQLWTYRAIFRHCDGSHVKLLCPARPQQRPLQIWHLWELKYDASGLHILKSLWTFVQHSEEV